MKNICPICLHIGEGNVRPEYKDDYNFPLAGFVIGLAFVYMPVNLITSFVLSIKSVFMLAFPIACFGIGAYLLKGFLKRNHIKCPKCNNGKMIELDTPEANILIQKYKLNA